MYLLFSYKIKILKKILKIVNLFFFKAALRL